MSNQKEMFEAITKTKNGPENVLLYKMCADWEHLNFTSSGQWENYELFGDEMALIGRAYAASPERRFTWEKETEDKIKKSLKTTGNGTGAFFYDIAKGLLANDDFQEIQKRIKEIQDKVYSFDGSEDDKTLLLSTVNIVCAFNKALKTEIKKNEEQKNGESLVEKMNFRNHISFCSKFFHFQYPSLFFIIDSFSSQAANKIKEKGWVEKLKISNIEKDEQKEIDGYQDYLKHCIHAYNLAAEIKEKTNYVQPKVKDPSQMSEFIPCTYPRIVDIALLTM